MRLEATTDIGGLMWEVLTWKDYIEKAGVATSQSIYEAVSIIIENYWHSLKIQLWKFFREICLTSKITALKISQLAAQ